MKGIAILTIALGLIIASVASTLFVLIPFLTFKYHLSLNLIEKYNYNNADLTLLSLISTEHNSSYSTYRVLSEHTMNGFDESMKNSLKEKINLMTNSTCFKIVNKTATILKAENCEPVENVGEINLFIPYNPGKLIEKLILVFK